MGYHTTSAIERLWKQTIQESATKCWLPQIFVNKLGYACIYYHGINMLVHRFSAHVFHGLDLKSDLQANHKRECPNRHCWNPDHIYVGNQKENMQDAVIAGTHPKPPWIRKHNEQIISSSSPIRKDLGNNQK